MTTEERLMHLESQQLALNRQHVQFIEQQDKNAKLLVQIHDGLLGNEFSNGMKYELKQVGAKINELQKHIDSLNEFRNTMKGNIAKGFGLISGIVIIFNFAWDYISHYIRGK